ncbi:MAG: chromate transporter [Lachnospiraceae bacterium]|nr:chromate transporter [Lachnospiraceae bacterium]
MKNLKTFTELYTSFFQIGGLTFGGGYAMLPMMQRELVDKKKWVSEEDILDYYAIGQCTPGVIAVNTATFVGYRVAGFLGAVFATLGLVTPSLIIITLIALFIRNFASYPVVQHALSGITIAVFALVLDAVITIGKKSLIDALSWILFIVVFIFSMFTKVPSAALVVGAGVLGVLFSVLSSKFKWTWSKAPIPEKKKEDEQEEGGEE